MSNRLLLSLHLSRHPEGFGKPSVGTMPAQGLNGFLHEGTLWSPDMQAIREALPHHYRPAFDRAGQPWYRSDRSGHPAHITLNNSRGKYLNTLYLIPYVYRPPVDLKAAAFLQGEG